MKFGKRCQISVEFILIISTMFVVFVIFTIGIIDKYQDIEEEREYVIVRDIAYKIRNEVNLAYNVQPGYIRNFSIPQIIDGINFSVNVSNGVVIVQSNKQEFSTMIPIMIGCISKGENTIRKLENSTILSECT